MRSRLLRLFEADHLGQHNYAFQTEQRSLGNRQLPKNLLGQFHELTRPES